MPQKSRRKKQLSHIKAVKKGAPAQPIAAGAPPVPQPVAAPARPAIRPSRQPAQLNWPLHVGSEIRRISIIAGAIMVVLIIVSLFLT